MKLKIILAVGIFALTAISFLPVFDTTAKNKNIAERFASDTKKKDTGVTGTYNFDKAHTFIGFQAKHMGLINVPGYFRDFTGTVNFDAADMKKSSVEFSAKIASVDTGAAGRNSHLQKEEFFDAEKYPEMIFKSTKLEKKGKQWMMTGDLTMRGVTKSVSFPFEVVGFIAGERGTRMGITAETSVNRRDYGINYDSKLPNGTPSVSDEIKVTLQIEATMSAAAKPAAE
ncbi:MAG: YceI family protein [Pyrinomonadaceae bacterium]